MFEALARDEASPSGLAAHDFVAAARLYRLGQNVGSARSCFARALAREPLAIEAAIGLLECGEQVGTVLSLAALRGDAAAAAPFLPALIQAHAARVKYDYVEAHQRLCELEAVFPASAHVMQHLGVTRVRDGFAHLALATFSRLREVEPFYVDAMDTYGSVIKLRGTSGALRTLTAELFAIDKQRPEAWCVAAMHSELEGDKQRALQLVEKALALDDQHVFAYLLRGALFLSFGLPKRAQLSFARALLLTKDHSAYQGCTQAYLLLEDLPRALTVAREASRVMPRSARALALVGLVLSCDQAQRRKARRVFEQALAMRPRCIEAVLSLADLDAAEGQVDEAVKRLTEQLAHDIGNAEFIRVKLGDVLAKTNADDALAHYRAAQELNPQSEGAAQGMVRLLNRSATATEEQRSGALSPDTSAGF